MDAPEIPGYEIGRLLGHGGAGRVYRARELATQRDVALKWLPRTQSATQRARFQREARAAAALRHPHIATVFTAGEAKDGFYIVMELVPGYPLSQVLPTRTLGVHALVEVVAKVARALHAAHEAGVLHRDVKPRTSSSTAPASPGSSTSASRATTRTRRSRRRGSSSGPSPT